MKHMKHSVHRRSLIPRVIPLIFQGGVKRRNLPVWNMVRGVVNTYDLTAHGLAGSQLVEPPAGVTLTDGGILSVDPPHHNPLDYGELQLTLASGLPVTLPTQQRDWRITDSDFSELLAHSYSAWRTPDGAADTRLFTVSLLDPRLDLYPNVLEADIHLSTGVDGKIDVSPLESAFASYTSAIAVVTSINDLMTENSYLTPEDNKWFLYAWKDRGAINYFTTPTGVRVWRSNWQPAEFNNSQWNGTRVSESEYNTNTSIQNESWWGSSATIRRRRTVSSVAIFGTGDANRFPGVNSVNDLITEAQGYRIAATYVTGYIRTDTEANYEWINISGLAHQTSSSDSVFGAARIRYAASQHEATVERQDLVDRVHAAAGALSVRAYSYDVAEMLFIDPIRDDAIGESTWNALKNFEYNTAAVIGNQHIDYR